MQADTEKNIEEDDKRRDEESNYGNFHIQSSICSDSRRGVSNTDFVIE